MPMEKRTEHEEGKDSLIERVGLYIPIYKGYKEQNLRRDEDRAVRQELVLTLEGAKESSEVISEASAKNADLMVDINRICEKLEEFLASVVEMVNGYSGWHASADSLEEELQELISWDSKLIDDTVLLRETFANLVQKIDLGEYAIMTPLKDIEKVLDRLVEDYEGREAVMMKFIKKD